MDDDIGLSGSEGLTPESAEPEVVYEIDAGDAGGQSQAAQPAVPAAPPPPQDPRDHEIADLRRQMADMGAQLSPWLAHLQHQQRQGQDRPPFTPEELDTNPNLKPSDIVKYLQWAVGQESARMRAEQHGVARSTLSEQQARGEFSSGEMGEGNDYDTMVNRYVAPIIAQNPGVEAILQQVFPNNPAGARMILATIVAITEQNGGDLVKGIKHVLNGAGAYQQGARETQQAISRGAQAAAARVLPGSRAGARAGVTTKKLETAQDVWNLRPRDFDRMYDQAGRGQ